MYIYTWESFTCTLSVSTVEGATIPANWLSSLHGLTCASVRTDFPLRTLTPLCPDTCASVTLLSALRARGLFGCDAN